MMKDLLEEFNEIPVPVEEPTETGDAAVMGGSGDDGDEKGDAEDEMNASLLEEGNGGKKKKKKRNKMSKLGLSMFSGGEDEDEKMAGNSDEEEDEDDAAAAAPKQKSELEIFFEHVSMVRNHITMIKQSTEFVKEMTTDMQEKALSDADTLKRNKMFSKVITKTNRLIKDLTESVKRIKEYNDTFAAAHPDELPLLRIRSNIYGTLCKNFRDTVEEYNSAQEAQKRIVKEKLLRQCHYINTEVDEPAVEKALEEGNTQVFRSTLAASSGEQQQQDLQAEATQALAYVENKHNEIVTLTNSMRELHQLFLDLSFLVENQGELIDDIEDNCRRASEYVEKGVENLHQANVYQKKARKKLFWVYGLIVGVFGLLIVGGAILGIFF